MRTPLPSLSASPLVFLLCCTLLAACEPEEPTDDEPTPGVQVDNWCDAGLGGAPGERDFEHDLAAAHALQRLFSTAPDWMPADEELSQLLGDADPFQLGLLESYAEAFDAVCSEAAVDDTLSDSQVDTVDGVAVVVPGQGPASLPADTTSVVIDLRTAPPSADIAGAIALALADDVTLGSRQVQRFTGLPSHDDGWTHYDSGVAEVPVVISGSADEDLPLAFITPTRLTPEAATWVAGLRLAGRAAIVGHDVFAAVAESSWAGVGAGGLLVRTSTLHSDQSPWPDVVPADISTETPDLYLDQVADLQLDSVDGDADRASLVAFDRTGWDWLSVDATLTTGRMRAGLLIGWGVLDRFYPFFDLVGRELDDQLLDSLDEVALLADDDRRGFMGALGHFMHDLYDGHGFYSDWAGDWPSGYLIVQIQRVDGEAVVRSSEHEGIEAGDTIVGIDGVPASDWYEEAMGRYSASSDGYRFVLATGELKEVWGSRELVLRDPGGAERTVTALGRPWEDQDLVPWGGTFRPNGWLDELGADDIYYVNLAAQVSPDEPEVYDAVVDAIVALEDGQKLVLDMRDYPALNYYELERHLHTETYTTPQFWFPTWTGPDAFELVEDSWSFSPESEVWTGPIAILMSNKSVSSAENVAQMLDYLPNVTVVGQLSACTNGTVTSFWLPGNVSLTFTAMRLRNPDGSEFHGIGVVPDVEVTPSPAQFAAGEDPELQAAVDVLQGG